MTLADVARVAGVSTATVSNALNSVGRMSQSTRRQVRSIARELGYIPWGAGHGGLPDSRVLGLAVTTDHPVSWGFAEIAYFSQAVQAATAVAHEHGYSLIVQPTAIGPERHADLAVDGMMLIDSPQGDPVRAELRRRGVPVVFSGRPPVPEADDVWIDNDLEGAVRGVLDHLATSGARRVALLGGDTTDHYIQSCMTTYRQWCAERGQQPMIELMSCKDPAPAAARLLARRPAPDAIYGPYDRCGHAVLSAARDLNLRVPEQLRVVCASESVSYEQTAPPVTTLSLDPLGITRLAMELLIEIVEGGAPTARTGAVHPTRLFPRASSLSPEDTRGKITHHSPALR